MHGYGLAILVGVSLVATASAQGTPWRFHWQPGQVLSYAVESVTTVTETVGGSKIETTSKVSLLKRWQVLAVDGAGVATLQLTLASLRNEQTRPDGGVLLFDSAHPEKSTPELREQMARYVGRPLAVLRVDGRGKVVEVKQGDAARYESEPPFVLELPLSAPAAGHSWERTYRVTLGPPLGTGEKYDALQRYACDRAEGGTAVVRLTTQFKTLPRNLTERLPLLQKQPEGEVVFDVRAGRLQSARLWTDRVLEGHQGPGSSYRFQNSSTERYVDR